VPRDHDPHPARLPEQTPAPVATPDPALGTIRYLIGVGPVSRDQLIGIAPDPIDEISVIQCGASLNVACADVTPKLAAAITSLSARGQVYVIAFSAGGAAVRALDIAVASRIRGLVLADAIYGRTPEDAAKSWQHILGMGAGSSGPRIVITTSSNRPPKTRDGRILPSCDEVAAHIEKKYALHRVSIYKHGAAFTHEGHVIKLGLKSLEEVMK
jgi:pimeloyl-ACP methyl ester carboxylesterase